MRLRGGRVTLPTVLEPTTPPEQQTSKFFDLPPEIRCMIYRLAISYHTVSLDFSTVGKSRRISLKCGGLYNWAGNDLEEQDRQFTALIKTCKLVSVEAVPILFDQTQFSFSSHTFSRAAFCSRFLHHYTDVNQTLATMFLGRIRHLCINLPSSTRLQDHVVDRSLASLVKNTNKGSLLRTIIVVIFEDLIQDFHGEDLASKLDFESFGETCVVEFPDMAISEEEEDKFKRLLEENHGMKAEVFMSGDWPAERNGWSSSLPIPAWALVMPPIVG